jgi:hypothetical protein
MCLSCIVPCARTSREINTLKDSLPSWQPTRAVVTHVLYKISTTSLAKATGEALSDISLGSAHREPEGPLIGFPILFCGFFLLAIGGEQAGQRLSLRHGNSVAELHALS